MNIDTPWYAFSNFYANICITIVILNEKNINTRINLVCQKSNSNPMSMVITYVNMLCILVLHSEYLKQFRILARKSPLVYLIGIFSYYE
jgi:hypothetical protein